MWHLRHNSQPNTFRKTTKVHRAVCFCNQAVCVVFTYFTYFNGTIVFTCFNTTIVFALAYTSARHHLRVVFTYFTDLKDHAQIKQSEPSHCADIKYSTTKPLRWYYKYWSRLCTTIMGLLLLFPLRCIDQELAHMTT